MNKLNALQAALNNIGHVKVADACKLSRQAIKKWFEAGKLPRTEYLPHTSPDHTRYAGIIARLSKGNVTKGELL